MCVRSTIVGAGVCIKSETPCVVVVAKEDVVIDGRGEDGAASGGVRPGAGGLCVMADQSAGKGLMGTGVVKVDRRSRPVAGGENIVEEFVGGGGVGDRWVGMGGNESVGNICVASRLTGETGIVD